MLPAAADGSPGLFFTLSTCLLRLLEQWFTVPSPPTSSLSLALSVFLTPNPTPPLLSHHFWEVKNLT